MTTDQLTERASLTLKAALELYQETYVAARNFAERSRVEYAHDLDELVACLEKSGLSDVGQVGLAHLQAYQAELDRRGLAGATRRRKTASVRSFLRFLHQSEYLASDLAARLIPPRSESKEPRFLSGVEYKRLLEAVRHETRDAAIIELLLQTGLRLSEVTRLVVEDLQIPPKITPDPENAGFVTVRRGKGRKDRTLVLNHKACKALKAYLKVRPEVGTRVLFLSKFRKPLGPRGLQKLVEKYLKEAGIAGASVHSLRHTFATHHVAQKTSLKTVQEALGHESLKTTSIYVSLAREVMKKEMQEHAL